MCYTHSKQMKNILKKLPGVTVQARKATTPLETWKCLIIDEILDDIFQHINQHILIQPNFSHASDTRFKDKIEIKASISLLCVAGELRNDKQSRKEFRFTDRNGIEKFRLLMNQ